MSGRSKPSPDPRPDPGTKEGAFEAGFFLLQTPLLPFDAITRWGRDLAAPAALGEGGDLAAALLRDRRLLQERLREALARPEILDALRLAAPPLAAEIPRWATNPDSEGSRKVQDSLVRYFLRMAARTDPYGLIAGSCLGAAGSETRLELAALGQARRFSRLEEDYLLRLGEALAAHPQARCRARHRPNQSLCPWGDGLCLIEVPRGSEEVSLRLVRVDRDPYLDAVLDRARTGATPQELARHLEQCDPDGDITLAQARQFIDELIDSQILVADLAPPATGGDPLDDLLRQAGEAAIPPELLDPLSGVHTELANLDRCGVGAPAEAYRRLETHLARLPVRPRGPRLLHVELVKSSLRTTLDPPVIEEVARGVRVLRRLFEPKPTGADILARVHTLLLERYGEGRKVRLLEALDPRSGIGLGELRPPPELSGGQTRLSPRARELFQEKLDAGKRVGAGEIRLTSAELRTFGELALPDLVLAKVAVAAPSPGSRGGVEPRIFLDKLLGVSELRFLGRPSAEEGDLQRRWRSLLGCRGGCEPPRLDAELLAQGPLPSGKALLRLRLCEEEIAFLAKSGLSEEHQIALEDLLVSAHSGKILLHSAKRGQRVQVHALHGHLSLAQVSPVFGLLAALGSDDGHLPLSWDWGEEDSETLPRVVTGRTVLARARWRIGGSTVRRWLAEDEPSRFRQVQLWRARHCAPRWLVMVEAKKSLLVDLDNALSIDALLSAVARYDTVRLEEMFPPPEKLLARGPEGAYEHRLLIPLLDRAGSPA